MDRNIHAIRLNIAERLGAVGIENGMSEAKWLIIGATGISESEFITAPNKTLTNDQMKILESWVLRRLNHEPLSRIKGVREFWSLDFILNEDTLDPRPDSEILVEAALRYLPSQKEALIADLGTGTGCLGISILHERPLCHGIGVDRSFQSCQAANLNASRHGLDDRFLSINSSWTNALSPHKFDLIISNPPYISDDDPLDKNVAEYDPKAALFAGQDGLDAYCAIAQEIGTIMHKESILILEIGHTQRVAVYDIFSRQGLALKEAIQDLEGRDRCMVFVK